MRRINSPSSIIAYLQCPRLYYYRFIKKRDSFPHIDLVKGSIIHVSLQEFFSDDPPIIERNYDIWASEKLNLIFLRNWGKRKVEIQKLKINGEEISKHKKDCLYMLNNWLNDFLERIKEKSLPFKEAFEKLKPVMTEESFFDETFNIKGVIDIIEENKGEIKIIDYKTSSKFDITKEHKMQLSIYAYLYYKKFGRKPNFVGIFFLREKLHLISVDQSMINYGEGLCKEISEKTESDDLVDYPQGEGYLCRALGGKCPCHKFEEEQSI